MNNKDDIINDNSIGSTEEGLYMYTYIRLFLHSWIFVVQASFFIITSTILLEYKHIYQMPNALVSAVIFFLSIGFLKFFRSFNKEVKSLKVLFEYSGIYFNNFNKNKKQIDLVNNYIKEQEKMNVFYKKNADYMVFSIIMNLAFILTIFKVYMELYIYKIPLTLTFIILGIKLIIDILSLIWTLLCDTCTEDVSDTLL